MLDAARYLTRRGLAWLRRRLLPAPKPRHEPAIVPYPTFIERRLKARQAAYPPVDRRGLFSLITPVFDPPSGYFRQLGRSILSQDHTDWQWVIVNNGCQHSEVLYLMKHFARDSRVTLVEAGSPRGIIGGMRLALEHARNEYVLPVDHDDRLYPDALRVIAACLQARDWPVLAYTDEDKILPDGSIGLPAFKPDWDPLLFLNACYIAHQGVMHRKLARQIGVYTDPEAEGTPDGDAFCRFLAAGHTPLHIPEIVYSWRMHSQSTALHGVDAKPYVTANQKHVLNRYLNQIGLGQKVTVRTNSLPGIAGAWRVEAPPVGVPLLLVPTGDRTDRASLLHLKRCSHLNEVIRLRSKAHLHETLHRLPPESWVVLLHDNLLPTTTNFVQEFMSVVTACPMAVLAGGTLHNTEQRVISAGNAWGMNGLLASPFAGEAVNNYSAGQGGLCLQRCVTSVDSRFCFVQVGFLRQSLERVNNDLHDPLLSAWWGAMAEEQGRRVVYTPYVKAQFMPTTMQHDVEDISRYQFLQQHGHRLVCDRYYSRFLGLTAETCFQPVQTGVRYHTIRSTLCALADSEIAVKDWMGYAWEYRSFLEDRVSQGRSNDLEEVA